MMDKKWTKVINYSKWDEPFTNVCVDGKRLVDQMFFTREWRVRDKGLNHVEDLKKGVRVEGRGQSTLSREDCKRENSNENFYTELRMEIYSIIVNEIMFMVLWNSRLDFM